MLDLYKKYKTENAELTDELKNKTNDVLTNDRKTYYEDQQNDTLNGYYYYFFMVVYLIIVACFGIFSLTYPSIYSWKAKAFLFLLFLLIPLVSTWILGKIIQIIYFLFNLLPKNVYK
jgi:Fe2+ transport system protein B